MDARVALQRAQLAQVERDQNVAILQSEVDQAAELCQQQAREAAAAAAAAPLGAPEQQGDPYTIDLATQSDDTMSVPDDDL
eukprot:7638522-Lingulodinium_polyedra.AAC.1